MTSRAEQYRQLARDFHFMALEPAARAEPLHLAKMADECERLADQCERVADQQEQATDLRQERSNRARRRKISLAEKPIAERLNEQGQKQAYISSEAEG